MQGMRVFDNVVEVDVSVDSGAHAAGDVVCQPIELANVTNNNGAAVITSIVIADPDDQGIGFEAVFLKSPIAVGDNNAAMTISDALLDQVLGSVSVTTYLNLATNQVATATGCGLVVRPDPARGNSIWLALRTTGAPTYAGARLHVKVGVLRG